MYYKYTKGYSRNANVTERKGKKKIYCISFICIELVMYAVTLLFGNVYFQLSAVALMYLIKLPILVIFGLAFFKKISNKIWVVVIGVLVVLASFVWQIFEIFNLLTPLFSPYLYEVVLKIHKNNDLGKGLNVFVVLLFFLKFFVIQGLLYLGIKIRRAYE